MGNITFKRTKIQSHKDPNEIMTIKTIVDQVHIISVYLEVPNQSKYKKELI